MNNSLLAKAIALMITAAVAGSCASTSGTTEAPQRDAGTTNVYPSWYDQGTGVKKDTTAYYGYGIALAADSATAAGKAQKQARADLQTSVSTQMESIRSDAFQELSNDSGLRSARFILALRKAEAEAAEVATMSSHSVSKNPQGSGYRGFVKVAAEKSLLLTELDKALSDHGSLWNALKGSDAFQQF